MTLRRSPLYGRHAAREADFTEFGGWDMPVTFDGIRTEHAAVREAVGTFDVSHMGEIVVAGADAEELCQRLTTNDVSALAPGRAHYSTVTNDRGEILDDIMLFRLAADRLLFVPNAGKDEAMATRWREHRSAWELDATVDNRTDEFAMLAVQGPEAVATLAEAGVASPDEIPKHGIESRDVAGVTCWCARTGYTGEDGFELLVPWDESPAVDEAIPGQRCGLGARDTLRLEMGYLLAGNEFDQADNPRTPLEAGLEFVLDLDARPRFVGHQALVDQREAGPAQRLVGIRMRERGIPRTGYAIVDGDGEDIGEVTSGTMSPTLDEPIGLGYVDVEQATAGTDVGVRIRGARKKARIVTPPFLEAAR